MASPRKKQIQQVARTARKAWPYVMMAYERWQKLTPEQRERYLRQAREAGERLRRGRGGSGGRGPRRR